MKFAFVSLVLLTVSASASAQAPQWERVWPATAPSLVDVSMSSALDGWAADGAGGVLHTATGGTFWTRVQTLSSSAQAIAVRGSTAWLAGSGIQRSLDAGQTWTSVDTTSGLEDVWFTSASAGWAVGASGAARRSLDGGATWVPMASNVTATLRAVHFTDALRGFAVGDNGTLISSTDGGASWQTHAAPSTAHLTDVFFADALRGWITAGTEVLRSVDGGASWLAAVLPAGARANRLSVLGGNWLWTTGSPGVIAASQDGGASWSAQFTTPGVPLFDVAMGDLSSGLAVGVDGRIFATTNGAQWSASNGGTPAPTNLVFDIVQRGARVWAAGTDSKLLRSTDSGAHWQEITAGLPQIAYRALDFFDDLRGYAVGSRQGFYPTTAWTSDGGLSWNPTYATGMYEFWDVDAVSATTAIASADNGLWRTTNGGMSWNFVTTTPLSGFFGADFVDASNGWAVGYDFFKTSDGGQTWTHVLTPAVAFRDVAFADLLHGWAVGDNGAILATVDGGSSWTPQSAGAPSLWNVEALSANVAWISGVGGFVARTSDGGGSWIPSAPADFGSDDSYGSSFDAPDSGFLCGYYPSSGIWKRSAPACSAVAYCQGKVNSLGCTPQIEGQGSPSASASSGFTVRVTQSRNHKVGLLFYSDGGRAAVPFTGGILCVAGALRRVQGLDSGGTPSPANDCSGVFAVDMNAFRAGALGGNPASYLSTVGTVIDCQVWGRDPGYAAPDNTQLSPGLEYVVCP